MSLTLTELQDLADLLAPTIKAMLEVDSEGVGELEIAEKLDNVVSLPALRKIGDIRSVVDVPLSLLKGGLGKSAFQLWQEQPGNEGKTYEDYEVWLRQPATDAAKKVEDLIDEGFGNIKLLSYAEYQELEEKMDNTLYACLDIGQGRITRAFIGVYPFLCSGYPCGGETDNDRFTYTFPFRMGGSGGEGNNSFDYTIPFVLQ